MNYSVGIDLGTTFSAVSWVGESGRPVILPNSEGHPITPSVVFFDGGTPVVGEEAKEMQALGEENVAFLFKRCMGDPNYVLEFDGVTYTPVDLSALLLKKLVKDAEVALSGEVVSAVITVPAYFDNQQRQATISAGEQARLNVLCIINEPTAAALAYGLNVVEASHTVLVYDLGGGTFDVTVVRITGDCVQVLGTAGDHELGGKDWDDRIAQWAASRFQELHGVNPLDNGVTANDLLVRCENAKKQLSNRDTVSVTLVHEGEREKYELSRDQFQELTCDLMERTQVLCNQILQEINLNWEDLDGVLLAGGSTRMPMVRRYVSDMSGKAPLDGVNVDEAVACGAAIQASMQVPELRFRLPGCKSVSDVMSHSLGMVAVNEDRSAYINSVIIPKNRRIPCTEKRPFRMRTYLRGDHKAEVFMLQGESENPSHATVLGKYTFSGLEYVSGGVSVLDICYAYDKNGLVTVTASQRENNNQLGLTVEPVPKDMSWLSRAPVEERETSLHIQVLIAVDLSGSMSGEPLREARKAARNFMEQLDLGCTSVGLIGFADQVKIASEFSQDTRRLLKGVNSWTSWMSTGDLGWGNEAEPFSQAMSLLDHYDGPRFLIVLTDGVWCYQKEAVKQAEVLRGMGVEIIALGFGSADKLFLKAIATCDENALFADLKQLTSSFSKIAQVLTESAAAGRGGKASMVFLGMGE